MSPLRDNAPHEAIERALDEATQAVEPVRLREAVRYAVLGGGKRVRPVLAWRACQAAGGQGPESLPAALAVELVHTFSLVHDDLPALDNDDLRRGRPTLHVHAGEALAILAGDAMLALAFRVLVDRVSRAALARRLAAELARATGEMIAGQSDDVAGEPPPPRAVRQYLETVHRRKTAALIRAACRMGALCADADASTLASITDYAEAVGLMFQIVDDLLDVQGTVAQTGTPTRQDVQAGRLTWPGMVGVPAARAEVRRLTRQALHALAPLGPHAEGLRQMARDLARRRG